MEYDIFLSYAHKDANEVMQILKALQNLGLKVWIDKSEIHDFESITYSIVEGLAQSKVLLAYYSLNYWRSRACHWELTAAFLAAQSEGDPRKRVLIINPEEKAEHIHPVELRDELFLTKFKDVESLDHLVSSIKNKIQEITTAIGEVRALRQPRWYGNKGVGSNRFVGRLPDMWKIHSALHDSGVPIITRSFASPVVQVYGMGGVGKSLLAEEYALRYAAAFSGGVFWLRAFGNDDLRISLKPEELEAERIRQIGYIAVAYGIPIKDLIPEEIEAHLASELGRHDKPFLWIVDDVPYDMTLESLQRWFAPNPLGKTLITTRSKDYSSLGKFVPLGVLEPQEAWELLTLWRKPEKEEEKDAALMLIEDLGCHALAVDVAGAALHASEGLQSFSEFREELTSPTNDELELAAELTGMLPTGHEKSIASTLFRSIERLGVEGRDFLRLASMLATAPIPASLVSAVFSMVDNLDERSGKIRAMKAIFQADHLSLAETTEDESGARSVHVLISRTVRFKDSQPERLEMLHEAAIRALISKLSIVAEDQVHSELRLIITHARELVNSKENILTADLMRWVARYDLFHGAYKSAETLLRQERDIRSLSLGTEHPDTLTTMNLLASTLSRQGDYAGASKLNEQILELRRKILGNEHIDTIATMNNYATTLIYLGDYQRARKLQEQALNAIQKVLGEEHPHTLTIMSTLAETLRLQGDYEGARKLNEQVLGMRRIVLGNDHPSTLMTMGNLAGILDDQGNYEGARKLQVKVLEARQKLLGDDHPDTLMIMSNLAETLRLQGDYEGARKLNEQVLKILQKVLGAEHPYTLSSMNNLASTLGYQGDYEGARKLKMQVLDIRWKVLGAEHPDTLSSMNNLASTLSDQGNYEGARKLQEKVLEMRRELFGAEHSDTLISMNNLANTLSLLGDYEGARKLNEKVLDIRRKVLGAGHPDTLSSMNNLATNLYNQGNFEGARNIQVQVLKILRKVLGTEHPSTLTAMNNLASILSDQGDYEGARKLQEQVLDIRRKVLGAEHSDTLTTMNNLAITLCYQGDYQKARKLQAQVLEILRKVLGTEHPRTLTTMNNLASMLSDQGDYEGARKLQMEILEISFNVFGAKHPTTSMSAWNLFVTLLNMNEIDVANDITEKHLLWLVDIDPTHLAVEQQVLREMVIKFTGGKDIPSQLYKIIL